YKAETDSRAATSRGPRLTVGIRGILPAVRADSVRLHDLSNIWRMGMNASIAGRATLRLACASAIALTTAGVGSTGILAQSKAAAPAPQKLDADYTAKIKAATADPRILTELVDHMPASDKVPSPLKFFGYIPGEPGHMTYYKDIARYLDA